MNQTRWTLRELLLAVALLSVGLALFRLVWMPSASHGPVDGLWFGPLLLAHMGSGAAFGAGLGIFLKKPWLGARMGALAALVAPCCLGVIG